MTNADYRLVKLRDLTDVQLGYQQRKQDAKAELTLKRDGSAYPLIQVRDIDAQLRYSPPEADSVAYLTERQERYILREEDVLFQAKGHRNIAVHAGTQLSGRVPVGYFYILRLQSDQVLPAYLAWALNQPSVQNDLKRRSQLGAAMPVITRSVFAATELRLPPQATQQMIIELHDLAEREQALSSRITELRHLQAQAAISKIATGQTLPKHNYLFDSINHAKDTS